MQREANGAKLVSNTLKRNLDAVEVFIDSISEKYALPFEDVLGMLGKKGQKDEIQIPSCIFREQDIGIMESVSKYLKEERKLTYHKIAVLLKRDDRVIWVTYNKAKVKKKEGFSLVGPNQWLPVSIFTDGVLGPLESISVYLIDDAGFNFKEACALLNRSYNSVWTCYHKAKEKLKGRRK